MGVLRGQRRLSPTSKYGTKPRPGRKLPKKTDKQLESFKPVSKKFDLLDIARSSLSSKRLELTEGPKTDEVSTFAVDNCSVSG